MNADKRVMEFFPELLTAEKSDDVVRRIQKHFSDHGFGLYAVKELESQNFIGFVGIQNIPIKTHFTPAIEIGWRIAYPYWGKGYAPEAASEVLRIAFEELNLKEILALTYKENHRSMRVMQKLHMSYLPEDDFLNPHPQVKNTWLEPHVLYRISRQTYLLNNYSNEINN